MAYTSASDEYNASRRKSFGLEQAITCHVIWTGSLDTDIRSHKASILIFESTNSFFMLWRVLRRSQHVTSRTTQAARSLVSHVTASGQVGKQQKVPVDDDPRQAVGQAVKERVAVPVRPRGGHVRDVQVGKSRVAQHSQRAPPHLVVPLKVRPVVLCRRVLIQAVQVRALSILAACTTMSQLNSLRRKPLTCRLRCT